MTLRMTPAADGYALRAVGGLDLETAGLSFGSELDARLVLDRNFAPRTLAAPYLQIEAGPLAIDGVRVTDASLLVTDLEGTPAALAGDLALTRIGQRPTGRRPVPRHGAAFDRRLGAPRRRRPRASPRAHDRARARRRRCRGRAPARWADRARAGQRPRTDRELAARRHRPALRIPLAPIETTLLLPRADGVPLAVHVALPSLEIESDDGPRLTLRQGRLGLPDPGITLSGIRLDAHLPRPPRRAWRSRRYGPHGDERRQSGAAPSRGGAFARRHERPGQRAATRFGRTPGGGRDGTARPRRRTRPGANRIPAHHAFARGDAARRSLPRPRPAGADDRRRPRPVGRVRMGRGRNELHPGSLGGSASARHGRSGFPTG